MSDKGVKFAVTPKRSILNNNKARNLFTEKKVEELNKIIYGLKS